MLENEIGHLRINENDLERDEDMICHNGMPFTGTAYSLYEDGRLSMEATYKDGFRHGYKREWYYPSGQIALEIEYRVGRRHGHTKHWYRNGTVKIAAHYEYGIELSYQEWAEDGTLLEARVLDANTPGANYWLLLQLRKHFEKNSS
jgi:antitoxin component YwqK of YwqJK toxin-antitoxin module